MSAVEVVNASILEPGSALLLYLKDDGSGTRQQLSGTLVGRAEEGIEILMTGGGTPTALVGVQAFIPWGNICKVVQDTTGAVA